MYQVFKISGYKGMYTKVLPEHLISIIPIQNYLLITEKLQHA